MAERKQAYIISIFVALFELLGDRIKFPVLEIGAALSQNAFRRALEVCSQTTSRVSLFQLQAVSAYTFLLVEDISGTYDYESPFIGGIERN